MTEPININHLGRFMRFTIKSDRCELFDSFQNWEGTYTHRLQFDLGVGYTDLGIMKEYSTNICMN